MGLYHPWPSEEEGQEFGHTIFEPLSAIEVNALQD